jgi:hypothetical protein
MEGMKPNLDVFDDPRFSEWRQGDDCSMAESGPRSAFGCNFAGLIGYLLGLFGV